MKTIAIVLFIFLVNGCFCFLKAQEGYRISVEVKELKEGDLMLGYHYGNSKYLVDTAKVVSQGKFLFEGSKALDPGVYILVFPGNTFFDLVIDKNQHFEIITGTGDFIQTTTFRNSPENTRFFYYLKEIGSFRQMISANNAELQGETTPDSRKDELKKANTNLNSLIIAKQDSYIYQFPDGLFSKILLAQRDPVLIAPPEGLDDEKVKIYNYYQYKNRYWENFDFADLRLLRSPVYHGQLNRFFSDIVVQHPDSLIKEADLMVDRARVNPEVFRYTIWFITNHFERSQIMGHDAIFVHMLEKYYLTHEAYWVTDESKIALADRVRKMKPLLIGKVAPNINVFLPNRQSISLHQIEAEYLILYFWDSNCGHCKKETPRINGIYQKYKDLGLNVFALNLDSDFSSWQKAIDEYQIASWNNATDPYNESGFREKYDVFVSPIIFLLDREKRIMAKRIDGQVLERFIQEEIEARLPK